jgi:hypothetical protein
MNLNERHDRATGDSSSSHQHHLLFVVEMLRIAQIMKEDSACVYLSGLAKSLDAMNEHSKLDQFDIGVRSDGGCKQFVRD